MSYHEHRKQAPESVTCAVLTISDSRTEEDDESGKILRQKLEQNGHQVISHSILKNDGKALETKLEELLAQKDLQVIITSGGTGEEAGRLWRAFPFPDLPGTGHRQHYEPGHGRCRPGKGYSLPSRFPGSG